MRRSTSIKVILVISLIFFREGTVFSQLPDSASVRLAVQQKSVDSLVDLAQIRMKTGNSQEATTLAQKAYEQASMVDYHQGMGNALMVMGASDQSSGRSGTALRNYFTAMREYEWTGSTLNEAVAARTIGDIFMSAGLDEKALEYYKKALELGNALFPDNDLLTIREQIAAACLGLGRYDSAATIYRDLYQGYKNKGDKAMEISALNQLTACMNALQQYAEAFDYNTQALEVSRETGDKAGEMAALNNLGYSSKYLGKYPDALKYFQEAVNLGRNINAPAEEITVILTNIAIIYQNLDKNQEALDYLFSAEKIAKQAGDNAELSRIRHLIAVIYYLEKDYYNARLYNRQALELSSETGDPEMESMAYLTASNIDAALYDYESSMQNYRKYLAIRDSLQMKQQLASQGLSQQQYLVERTEKQLDEALYTRQVERMELTRLRLESEKKEQEVELLKKTTQLQESQIQNQELEKNKTMQELLLAEEKLATERKDREIKDLKVQQQLQESELRRADLEKEKQQQEIRVLTQEKQISDLKFQKIRTRNRFMAGIVLLVLLVLVIVIRSWRYARKTNKTLAFQRNKIQQQKEAIESQYEMIKVEQEKSEKLLLNILPEETAAELKEKGYASPQHYDMVTVLFTDFVGFTMISEKMTPEGIIGELDYCFLEFDRIIDRHNLEKIKTIGDSYMCAGGIPVANATNPEDVVAAALEIRDFMDNTKKARESRGETYWQLRIGVHTGPVIAGVVGKNKFAYDIWGDAVNTASRMESSGEAGKVNISGFTYELIRDKFDCQYRGKIKAKNKGEIDMYFVEGPMNR